MKNFLKFMLVAVVVSIATISCKDDPTSVTPGGGPYPYPLESFPKTSEGVTIKIADVTESDFTIITEMGLNTPAYRFDVMPLARFKNFLMEARKKKPELTEEEYIINTLFASDGSGGYILNEPLDMSWSESKFKQAAVIHGVDYIVLTCGALKDDGNVVGEVNTIKVSLTEKQLVGNPVATAKIESDFRAFEISYTMNEDCYGFYQLAPPAEDAAEAKKFFTPEEMRDLICCFDQAPASEDWSVTLDWGLNAQAGVAITAFAVGLDENGTLSKTFTESTAALQPVPDVPEAKYEVKLVNASATTVTTTWDVDMKVSSAAFHRTESASMWASIRANMSDKDLAIQLYLEGYGHNSPTTQIDLEPGLSPNTEHIQISTAKNKAISLLDIRELKFKTLPLVLDKPEESLAQVQVSAMSQTKTSVRVKYTVPEGTVMYYERILEKGYEDENGIDITDPINIDKVRDFLRGPDGNHSTAQAPLEWTWAGLEPGKTYYHYIMGEDKNGYMGPLFVAEYNTALNPGGPNPTATLEQQTIKQPDGSYVWRVKAVTNEDTCRSLFAILDDPTDPDAPMADRVNEWTDYVLAYGLTSLGDNSASKPVSQYSKVVAVAVPFGKVDGNEIQGAVKYLLFDPATMVSSLLAPHAIDISKKIASDKIKRVPVQ